MPKVPKVPKINVFYLFYENTNFALRLLLIILVALTVSWRGKGATQVAEFSDQAQTLPATAWVTGYNLEGALTIKA